MHRLFVMFAVVVLISPGGAGAQGPKYGVTVSAEKNVDYAKFKTYSWSEGRPSADKTVNGQIVAAIDRGMSGLGMTKLTDGVPDVRVAYYSLTRTDVDVKAKPDASGSRPEYRVGTLVVALLDPASARPLLRLRADKAVESGGGSIEAAINEAVAEMFAAYPTRGKK